MLLFYHGGLLNDFNVIINYKVKRDLILKQLNVAQTTKDDKETCAELFTEFHFERILLVDPIFSCAMHFSDSSCVWLLLNFK